MPRNLAEMDRAIRTLAVERGSILRFGHVVEVNEVSGSARVQIEDAQALVSMPLRVLQRRTLEDQAQELPDLGEPVACLFSGQGFEQGVILGACYSDKVPSPAQAPQTWYRRFKDGTVLAYDRDAHRLSGQIKGEVDLEVDQDVAIRCKQQVSLEAVGDISLKSKGKVTLEGSTAIILRTPSLSIQGLLGKICAAVMEAAFNLKGKLTHIGDYTQEGSHDLSGNVKAGGSVIDSGGNTNHHTH